MRNRKPQYERHMSVALGEIRGLTVRYAPRSGSPLLALDEVTLSIAAGEVVGVLGESGSGKSTLAAAILCLLPSGVQSQGSIVFEGRDLLSASEAERRAIRGRRISLIGQDPALALNPVMRAGTQISEVLRAHLSLRRGERKQRIEELLAEVGFEDPERIAGSYPHQLSGGERQRVSIAQAIACHPGLLIADEPTSKLDPALQAEILGLMCELRQRHGTAMLWITHHPATLVGFAERILVIDRGRIVEAGETDQILRRPQHACTQTLTRLARELALASQGASDFEYAN
jgi:ABC-type glutathione transport system ATPase component